jgi:hypothetical protein
MDPIMTAIVAALSAGAASGATDVAKKAIADGYAGLKSLISKKFGGGSGVTNAIEKFEETPDSPTRQNTLAEKLKATKASEDPEVLSAAQSLLESIKGLPQGEQHIQHAVGTGIAQADRGGTASVSFAPLPTKNDGD